MSTAGDPSSGCTTIYWNHVKRQQHAFRPQPEVATPDGTSLGQESTGDALARCCHLWSLLTSTCDLRRSALTCAGMGDGLLIWLLNQ
jgi:hypothetical protein